MPKFKQSIIGVDNYIGLQAELARKEGKKLKIESQPEILKPQEVAKLLRVSRSLVYKLIEDGSLRAGRIRGKFWRIPRSEVLRICGGESSNK
jgi:excisionase family DNA binding protein